MFLFAAFTEVDFGGGGSGFSGERGVWTEAARVLVSCEFVFGVEAVGVVVGLLLGVTGLIVGVCGMEVSVVLGFF